MEKKEKHKKSAGGVDPASGGVNFEFGLGGLGGLFKGVEKLIDLAAELKDAGGALKQEGEVDLSHLRKGMKAVYGFSVKTMDGGKPIVEQFGNIKKTPRAPGLKKKESRLPMCLTRRMKSASARKCPGLTKAI